MGEGSKIEWTDHTFNPWWGCQRVSLGCERCYAETFSKRLGLKLWGPESAGTPRRFFGDKHWAEPLKWDRKAAAEGVRRRVFCASMADVFEDRGDLVGHRERLFRLIRTTPSLDWLLLTKRPQNLKRMLPLAWEMEGMPANVWLGTTAEDQARADERIPPLLSLDAAVHFVSYEPALGPVTFREDWLRGAWVDCPIAGLQVDPATGERFDADPCEGCPGWGMECGAIRGPHLDWIIVGGESGAGARSMRISWARSVARQCKEANVALLVKQLGSKPTGTVADRFPGKSHDAIAPGIPAAMDLPVRLKLYDSKGGDITEFPEDLRVRQFPEARC